MLPGATNARVGIYEKFENNYLGLDDNVYFPFHENYCQSLKDTCLFTCNNGKEPCVAYEQRIVSSASHVCLIS